MEPKKKRVLIEEGTFKGQLYAYFLRKDFYDYRRGWLRGACPECGREEKFGVHLTDDRSNCFVCGYHEKPLYVVKKLERFNTIAKTVSFLNQIKPHHFAPVVQKEKPEINVILPEGFILLSISKSPIAEKIIRYLKRDRGLELHDIISKRLGYVYGDSYEYDGYIIFPFFRQGQLIYFQGRTFNNKFPKFKNPKEDITGIGKGQVIYNIDCLWKYKEVYLVESILNALTLGDEAFSIGGKEISSWQLNQIITSPVELVNIILDPDAWENAIALGLKLVSVKPVRLILLPEEQDVNSLGKTKTMEILKSQDIIYNNVIHIKSLENGAYNYTF